MILIPAFTSAVYGLLSYTPLQYMFRSYEYDPDRRSACKIYADDASNPACCAVHFEHKIFFGGKPTPELLAFLQNKILTPEIQKECGVIYFFFPNEAWRDALSALYNERCEFRTRSLYVANSAPQKKSLPEKIIPITMRLMESGVGNKVFAISWERR